MNPEKLEQLVSVLGEAVDSYSEKKTYNARKEVRKVLQEIKVAAQEMRVWILKDAK